MPLILTNEIIVFQVTIAKEHKSPPTRGLSVLRDLLPQNLKDLSWKLMFVGTKVDRIERIAKAYSSSNPALVRVGWTVVDLMREDVIYTVCKFG